MTSSPPFPSGRQGPFDAEFHRDKKGIIRVQKGREEEEEEEEEEKKGKEETETSTRSGRKFSFCQPCF